MTVTAIVLGTGDRGNVYANFAFEYPQQLDIVGAADRDSERLERFSVLHELEEKTCYSNWKEVFEVARFADAVIITLPDHLHFEAASAALEGGYHVLLEKPMATTEAEIRELVEIEQQSTSILQVCHVLRYTDFYSRIKQLVDSGTVGDIVTMTMRENVSYYHYAHSYIRGNWHNRENIAPMILTKSSHDLDLMYWLVDSEPVRVASFGGQYHFGRDNQPEGAPDRCTDGCPVANSCLYYAPRIYIDIIPLLHTLTKSHSFSERLISSIALRFPGLKVLPPFKQINWYDGWPVNVIATSGDPKVKLEALKSGPYGRCVYAVEEHTVVDQQVVNIEFEGGVTVNFTMHGHSSEEGREIRIDGTRGTIIGKFTTQVNQLEVIDSLTNDRKVIDISNAGGHGGGDEGIMKDFLENITSERSPMTSGDISIVSHLLAFSADRARTEGRIVDFDTIS